MPYIGTSPSNGVRRVHTYTATASQTTFTGASNEGVTLSYVDTNYIDVFQNGVLLGSADYTSTSGTSVVLAQGASVDDLVVIVVYDVFSVADTVSKSSGGSFDSAVTFNTKLATSNLGTGAILQVQYLQIDTTVASISVSANTDTVVTQLTVNITPKSTSSIIRLDTHIFHEWANADAPTEAAWFFYRDTTKLAASAASNRQSGISMSRISYHASDAGSTPEIATYSYFDQPSSTSQITYKVGVRNHYATNFSLNRTINDTDQSQAERGMSFISATEIAG